MDGAVVGIRASWDITNGECIGRAGRNHRGARVWRGAIRGAAAVSVAIQQELVRRSITGANAKLNGVEGVNRYHRVRVQ